MANIKDLWIALLEIFGLGAATFQVTNSIDELLKSQEQNITSTGLTASHEEFLFWFNIFKVTVIFIVVVGFYAMKAYVYYKKNIKQQ